MCIGHFLISFPAQRQGVRLGGRVQPTMSKNGVAASSRRNGKRCQATALHKKRHPPTPPSPSNTPQTLSPAPSPTAAGATGASGRRRSAHCPARSSRSPFKPQRGENSTAQGNALGNRSTQIIFQALKGRNRRKTSRTRTDLSRPFRAYMYFLTSFPRALPWAEKVPRFQRS